ncbi:ribosome biogenesis GTP-binding protein YihA/YsxC [Weeksella sp. HMSC059D05]|uniref:ribosome biogenesis GTP-binding protein YihA/YsxC n=1 Tax=Weeksella sp. HMSC059D05 TaxID=1715139 RepID=UPI0008A3EA83|nr:ribosome biogenesis GTP-binding protein YihA/YsxC [Weeksella sp. HMSC059D05]OFM81951.1 YihA family ribosome biogenesis GTP-binding protein [Weeksella sp. HMSC059D05]
MSVQSAEFIKSAQTYKDCPKPDLPEYAFIGRSNVGKSSLINMLTNKRDLAKTSGTPGKTQLLNTFLINSNWYLTDLPGYGYAKVSKTHRAGFERMIYDYLEFRTNLVCTFVLVDSRHEPQKNDLKFMEWLGHKQIPFAIIFTKLDKLSSAKFQKNLNTYKRELLKTWEDLPMIFATSSSSFIGRNELLDYINTLTEQLKDEFNNK